MNKYRVTYISGINKRTTTIETPIDVNPSYADATELAVLKQDIRKYVEGCEKIVKIVKV